MTAHSSRGGAGYSLTWDKATLIVLRVFSQLQVAAAVV
jgi:hypothetical protein